MTITDYHNGNCRVTIAEDGTKTRTWDGTPMPEYPESLDLKITDYCDQGCAYCHEGSGPKGTHAVRQNVLDILADGQPGLEVAFGGGDVLRYPRLEHLLSRFVSSNRFICNITVNADSLLVSAGRQHLLRRVRASGIVQAVGVSSSDAVYMPWLSPELGWDDHRIVLHRVVGVNAVPHSLPHSRVLVLGYKRRKRGKDFAAETIDRRIAEWRFWAPHILGLARNTADAVVAFDNLALEQLGVRGLVPEDVWRESYMGDDGQFSMFVDAVTDTFAASSTDEEREPRNGRTIREMFAHVRGQRKDTP